MSGGRNKVSSLRQQFEDLSGEVRSGNNYEGVNGNSMHQIGNRSGFIGSSKSAKVSNLEREEAYKKNGDLTKLPYFFPSYERGVPNLNDLRLNNGYGMEEEKLNKHFAVYDPYETPSPRLCGDPYGNPREVFYEGQWTPNAAEFIEGLKLDEDGVNHPLYGKVKRSNAFRQKDLTPPLPESHPPMDRRLDQTNDNIYDQPRDHRTGRNCEEGKESGMKAVNVVSPFLNHLHEGIRNPHGDSKFMEPFEITKLAPYPPPRNFQILGSKRLKELSINGNHAEVSEGESGKLGPEKPPRTFLYDILTDFNSHPELNEGIGKTTPSPAEFPQELRKSEGPGGICKSSEMFENPGETCPIVLKKSPNKSIEGNRGRSRLPPPPLTRSKTESQIMLKPKLPDLNFHYGLPHHHYSPRRTVHEMREGWRGYGTNQSAWILPTPHTFEFENHPHITLGNDRIPPALKPQEDRISKSKSEWALNQVLSSGSRRNTVANVSGGTRGPGHGSLDSPKAQKIGIQQSLQNLVNQLFSASSVKDATSSTDSGIQIGSESLSSCETPVGDSTTDTGDSDCENDTETGKNARQVVEARKGYIRRVSSIRVQELGASLHRLIQSSRKQRNNESLFQSLLIVGLNRDPYTGISSPYIKEKYPPNAKMAIGVEQFCFPDSLEWPSHEGISAQSYTLAITDHKGSRKYGCCFRILPEGANICIPIAYCLISSHRAIGFYREVLRELTQRHGSTEWIKRFWIEELYKKCFPGPGESVSIEEPLVPDEVYAGKEPTFNHQVPTHYTKSVILKRRADQRLEEFDLVTLLTTIDLNTVLKIFGSLLLERKVVLISRALSVLSLCVEALESLLYPFSWQHTFVPILPLSMTDLIDAPAPFLIGVLKSTKTPWDKTLDEGIVVDLDENKILSSVGDEGTILPKRIHRKLRNALQLVLNLADQKESTKNVLISECFIRMFVETIGHHGNHVVVQPDGTKTFDRENFVKSGESKATQNFLEWFSEASMFHEFIQIRLKNTAQHHGLFDQRTIEQTEQIHTNLSNNTPLSFKNAKLFMKGTRTFGNWFK